jgi:hypothetical protein
MYLVNIERVPRDGPWPNAPQLSAVPLGLQDTNQLEMVLDLSQTSGDDANG